MYQRSQEVECAIVKAKCRCPDAACRTHRSRKLGELALTIECMTCRDGRELGALLML